MNSRNCTNPWFWTRMARYASRWWVMIFVRVLIQTNFEIMPITQRLGSQQHQSVSNGMGRTYWHRHQKKEELGRTCGLLWTVTATARANEVVWQQPLRCLSKYFVLWATMSWCRCRLTAAGSGLLSLGCRWVRMFVPQRNQLLIQSLHGDNDHNSLSKAREAPQDELL